MLLVVFLWRTLIQTYINKLSSLAQKEENLPFAKTQVLQAVEFIQFREPSYKTKIEKKNVPSQILQ